MQTLNYPRQKPSTGYYAATIGCFDGVHSGHRFVISTLMEEAKKRDLIPMAITFDRHPRQLFHPDWQPQLITDRGERDQLLFKTGISVVTELCFDQEMAQRSAREFMEQVLARDLRVRLLLTGYDNRFGRHSDETFDDYVAYGRELGIEVLAATPYDIDGQRISSSLVRELLLQGQVGKARHYLQRPYTLRGTVVKGRQVGRQLGFPTANLVPLSPTSIVPANGVYAVTVRIGDEQMQYLGVMNIGHRPTFDGGETSLEVHLLDFSGDLYGKELTVSFLERLREERRFNTPEALTAQMQKDVADLQQIISFI